KRAQKRPRILFVRRLEEIEGQASRRVGVRRARARRAARKAEGVSRRDPNALLAPARERGASLFRRRHPPERARRRHRRRVRARLPSVPRRAVPLRRRDRRGRGLEANRDVPRALRPALGTRASAPRARAIRRSVSLITMGASPPNPRSRLML